ncbi:MAG: hypothetical protein OEQ30_00405 [Gammaproteobacteria bacterium]|jgi:hypothetical protein|nr:hypothetical protein [Gammaproteobacteria bacterium]MDH3847079.1 hypothetical protein [Gammaproteobacteria bacterium]MDH3862939.1 hypothetical protein [Gammaproteobacteria bacterium]NCF60008.1 hypothetical protein [Gammaproteobacteria bacterium]
MQYQGPDAADLMNVFVLNDAFIVWQRTRPADESRERGLAPETRARLGDLGCEQRERLARTPFLLMSLAEDDEARWQSLFTERRTRDLLQCLQIRDEVASGLIAAGLGFLWQLARRNPYATRLVSGASLKWCEQLSACTLMDLFARALEDQTLLAPRMADNTDLWHRLLTAGVSNRRHVRLAARVSAMQSMLIERPGRAYRPLAAAACRMPPVKTRKSGSRGT